MSSKGKGRHQENDGDWLCPDAKCGNVNFAHRTECNRCGTDKGSAGDKLKKGGVEIGKTMAEKSKGLFSADDWQCKTCGNVNWARRNTCNMCSTPKMGKIEERTGYGGGYMERELVVEYKETKEDEESDGEYDIFGRKKKRRSSSGQESRPPPPPTATKSDSEEEDEDLDKYKLGSDEEDSDDEDVDLSKYALDSDEEEEVVKKPEVKPEVKARSSSRSSRSSSSSRSRSRSNSRSRKRTRQSRSRSRSSSRGGKYRRRSRSGSSSSRSSRGPQRPRDRSRSRSPR